MRVLFVSSEIFPMAKTGGLADVSAALPAALAAQDLDVRLVMPAYPSALRGVRGARRPRFLAEFEGLGRADVIEAITPDSSLGVALINSPALFERPGGPYHDERGREWRDNLKRFAMLSRAAAMLAGSGSPLEWRPDVVHLNDWQTGLTSALLLSDPARPIVVFTIHNISFPGIFPMARFRLLGLPEEMRRPEGIGYHRRFSLLKAGIQYADWVTTVSPTYAHEIQTRQFGFGFETLLASRAESLSGILNGIDTRVWDPAHDPHIAARYDVDRLSAKAACKTSLLAAFGLPGVPDAPLFGIVSRLTEQKGLDLVPRALTRALEAGARLVVLGTGDRRIERRFRALAARFPDRVGVRIEFSEPLAHAIEAGADMFLMPSRFEPSGLNQMYSLRYGTPPIVRAIGGLADSVIDANVRTLNDGTATGFVFEAPTAAALSAAVDRALALYAVPDRWRAVQRAGMRQDFGWPRAAHRYIDLYNSL